MCASGSRTTCITRRASWRRTCSWSNGSFGWFARWATRRRSRPRRATTSGRARCVEVQAVMAKPSGHIAIVGTGVIGAGWATHFLARGFEVRATDPGAGAEARLRTLVDSYWPAVEALGSSDGASRAKLSFTPDVGDGGGGAIFIQGGGA